MTQPANSSAPGASASTTLLPTGVFDAETPTMRLVTLAEYHSYVHEHKLIFVDGVQIPIGLRHEVKAYSPPEDYQPETTTVWSFPDRGDWATHQGTYRGNWSPYIPRNLILKYSKPGDWVLDQMVGSGTTLVEAKLLGRNAIGLDVNYDATILSHDRLNFEYQPQLTLGQQTHNDTRIYHGDARRLDQIADATIDLVTTHPPYWGIIRYAARSQDGSSNNLSLLRKLDDYLCAISEVARESIRVLKPGHYCAILIGDTRRHRHYVPISHHVLRAFLDVGYILVEDIIKVQHKMKSTRERWRGKRFDLYGFHLIAHEHLLIFRRPESDIDCKKHNLSTKEAGTWRS